MAKDITDQTIPVSHCWLSRLKKMFSKINSLKIFSASCGAMPCPFLSRLPSQFVKNYSGKLLKTYGDHCPVVSQGVTHSLAASTPTSKDTTSTPIKKTPQSKCPVVGTNFQASSEKNSPIKPITDFSDDIEVKEFNSEYILTIYECD